jgi:RHS repeat-associated protein
VAYLVFEEALVYPEPVVADFYATPLSGTVPLMVTLVNSSTGASSYLWDYGDRITSTASAVTHTHAYTATGVYTVALTASGPGGSDTLTRTNYITVSPAVNITYVYDPLYRLVTATYSTGEYYRYTYDAVGNRLSLTTTVGVVNYQYDAANRLTSVNGQAYTWDDNGNLLNDGLRSYSYDHANRLLQVVSGTLTTSFTYNGAGDRVGKTVDGVTTDYVLDPAAGLTQVLVESTGGQQTAYLYGHDLLAQYDSGTWAYHVNDGLGSVRQLADAAGQVVQSYSFDPFGVPLGESGGEPYGYTGEQWDAEVELLYLRTRYYEPGVGRFVSKDQWGGREQKPQTLNRFVYVTSNPIGTPSSIFAKGNVMLVVDPALPDAEAERYRRALESLGVGFFF